MLSVHDPEIDAIYRQTVGKRARTICVAAANPGDGVTTFALALARRGAAGGVRTLLFDAEVTRASATTALGASRARWSPDDPSLRNAVRPTEFAGLSVLPAPAGVEPIAFRDPDTLRRMFENDLESFGLIVTDTSAIPTGSPFAIPAEVVAAACSVTLFVVLTGVTSERALRVALERLQCAGATPCGVIMNDRFAPSIADELCRQARRLERFAPGPAAWMQRCIRRTSILNLQDG